MVDRGDAAVFAVEDSAESVLHIKAVNPPLSSVSADVNAQRLIALEAELEKTKAQLAAATMGSAPITPNPPAPSEQLLLAKN